MSDLLSSKTSFDLLKATQIDSKSTVQSSKSLKSDAKIEQAAQDFEAVFMGEMLKPMFEGLETESEFGGGHAESVYRSLLIQEMGKVMAQSGGLGLSDPVQKEMIRLQDGAHQ